MKKLVSNYSMCNNEINNKQWEQNGNEFSFSESNNEERKRERDVVMSNEHVM